jgi:uncharacterized protein YceH (UPF0502 family)
LSLNALVNACNQKSNREPTMQLDEAAVKAAADGLARRHMVVEKSGFGSRVPKYQQIFCNTEFGSLKFTPVETGIICELLLRGPQTPGELRTRVPRMAELPDPAAIEHSLEALANRPAGALVTQLAREPGRRDSRWAQLFEELPANANAIGAAVHVGAAGAPERAMASSVSPASSAPPTSPPASTASASRASIADVGVGAGDAAGLAARVAALEAEVTALRAELAALKESRT